MTSAGSKSPGGLTAEQVKSLFEALSEKYNRGELAPGDYENLVKALVLRDTKGTLWTIGAKTGKWYCRVEGRWIEGKPDSSMVFAGPGRRGRDKRQMASAGSVGQEGTRRLPDAPPRPRAQTPLGQCPSCGARLRAGARFCTECGARGLPETPLRPRAQTPPGQCPSCGARLRAGVRFCTKCGASAQ